MILKYLPSDSIRTSSLTQESLHRLQLVVTQIGQKMVGNGSIDFALWRKFMQLRQFCYQNRMESGTILHLALLRKVSCRQAQNKTTNHLQQCPNSYSCRSARTPSKVERSRQLLQISSSRQIVSSAVKRSKMLDQKVQAIQNPFQGQNHKISGWDIYNEQDHYETAIKHNDIKAFKKQPVKYKKQPKKCNQTSRIKNNDFCYQNLRGPFKPFNLVSQKKQRQDKDPTKYQAKQRSLKLKPISINLDASKQIKLITHKQSTSYDKQNLDSEYIKPRSHVRSKRSNIKDRMQKLNDFAKQFGDEFMRKRVC